MGIKVPRPSPYAITCELHPRTPIYIIPLDSESVLELWLLDWSGLARLLYVRNQLCQVRIQAPLSIANSMHHDTRNSTDRGVRLELWGSSCNMSVSRILHTLRGSLLVLSYLCS